MKKYLFIPLCVLLLVSCRTNDGQTDQATTEQVKAAIELPLASAVRRVILNNPEHKVELGNYFKGVRDGFCKVKEGQFTLQDLITQLDALTPPISDQTALDGKNLAVALLRIWAARNPINVTPQEWLGQVADTACRAIGQGITDAGL